MSEAKFTPGPWIADRIKNDIEIGTETDHGHLSVGWVHMGDERDPTQDEACINDANLMASAREMYEALKSALARVNDLEIIINEARELGLTLFMCGDTWPEKKTAIEAAIRKAEGR